MSFIDTPFLLDGLWWVSCSCCGKTGKIPGDDRPDIFQSDGWHCTVWSGGRTDYHCSECMAIARWEARRIARMIKDAYDNSLQRYDTKLTSLSFGLLIGREIQSAVHQLIWNDKARKKEEVAEVKKGEVDDGDA